jgi:beta-glucosidase
MSSLPIYKDPNRSPEERTKDLLARMTIPEKIGQLIQLDGDKLTPEDMIRRFGPGSVFHTNGEKANTTIRLALETRLGIPILLADDGIHGHSFWPGATIFPTQLGMSCSWDLRLVEEAARVTAREMRATGLKWTFSPVLCLTRDLRWGRVDETFGEDPWLIGELGCAMIRGYQGKGLHDPEAVLATAKHFAGYSETQGGRDSSESDISHRKLRSFFLPPFQKAALSGCMTFMTGYQSMEGIPATANQWLLKEVLKEEWGYQGIVVTDYNNVGRMVTEQKICADMAEASALALKSGNDLMMYTPEFFEGAQQALDRGMATLEQIDTAVARMLMLKFRMGLFENPGYCDAGKVKEIIGTAKHRGINLDLARESLVLLRNDGLLPLDADKEKFRLAVIGPNADDPIAQLGDWSLGSGQMDKHLASHPRDSVVTVLDGIRALAPASWDIPYAAGCSITDASEAGIPEAVKLALNADVVLLAIGDRIEFVGEEKSTATLELQGGQKALADAIYATGKPVIAVLINSKPMVLPASIHAASALVEAFNPGMQGGTAIAEALLGKINPGGKLTTSFPYHVGQQPIYYSQVRGQHGAKYADMPQTPVYAFGFGLSYTTYAYANLRVLTPAVGMSGVVDVEVTVKNTGDNKGKEIVQLYVQDVVTSATWVQKELKAFQKIELDPGKSLTVRFHLRADELTIVNSKGKRVLEPGEFKVMVGPSSRDSDLLTETFVVQSEVEKS